MHGGLLLQRGLVDAHAKQLHNQRVLSLWQQQCHVVHAGLILRRRLVAGAHRTLFGRLLLRRGLEHGDATSLHEYHLLSYRLFADNQLSDIWILRVKRYGELHLVHGRVLLQCHAAVGRVGLVFARLLLPDRVDLYYAANLLEDKLLSRNESKSNRM